MSKTAWLAGIALVSAIGAFSAHAEAQISGQIAINIGPPAARIEARPAPRRGMLWTPGFWDWQQDRHVWVAGHWERERTGYQWVQPKWVSHNGRWNLVRGHWAQAGGSAHNDRDQDGVPNRADRRPDNPRRQ